MYSSRPTSSLIISTYNWPEALSLSLKSVLTQKILPKEVIIADDGSAEATKFVIDSFRRVFPVPIKHVWHEDRGFRLAEIRNKAIISATGEYIIQIDGDIILHPHFVEDHLNFAKKNTFVRASRIYINKKKSEDMLVKGSSHISIFNKGINNFFSAIRMPFLWSLFEYRYKNKGSEIYEIHGCNMAYWKKDALAVNGYNETFCGWGPEDKEFVARLLNKGLRKRFLKLGAIAFHIHHKENAKTFLLANEDAFKQTREKKHVWCRNGILSEKALLESKQSLVFDNV